MDKKQEAINKKIIDEDLLKGHFFFKPTYQTDKFESGLMSEYINIFQALRYKPIKFLEIGTGQGGSLRFFEDYFCHPKTQIIGADRHKPIAKVKFKPSTFIEVGDQNDNAFLQKLGKEHGKFDIILDDGAHTTKETQNTYRQLFRFVKPGGYYLIEDWGAELLGDKYEGMISLVTNLAKKHVSTGAETTLKMGHRFTYLMIRKGFK